MNTATIHPPQREPNGRIKRQTQTDKLNELNRRQAEQETLIVRLQPHRRDLPNPESPLAGSALGRFVLKNKLRQEFYEAGDYYGTLVRKWQSVLGFPSMERVGGTGRDTTWELVNEWSDEIIECRRTMIVYGKPDGCLSIERMAVYSEEFANGASIRQAMLSLAALAYKYGKIDKLLFENIIS